MHKPELGEQGAATTRAFSIGHEVGDAACALYPDGLMIDASAGLTEAASATAAAMQLPDKRPLFEATFFHAGIVVRIDLLLPDANGWHVVEVKSTTRAKPYQHADLATQLWVLRGCGVPVSRASIRVIDTNFVLERAGDYRGLFVDVAADETTMRLVNGRAASVAAASAVLLGQEPAVAIGAHCSDPFYCAFDSYCRRDLPPAPTWPTSLLPGVAGKTLARSLEAIGSDDLLRVDAHAVSHPLFRRVHQATLTGVAYHDADGVVTETAHWPYLRTFLDFETIAFAVPRWIGTRPYSQVPFQFSAHVDHGTGELEHVAFLSTDGVDPRSACAAALATLPSHGAVIAWNAGFEHACLINLAQHAPEHADALQGLADRLVDLLPIARRHYYHRDMRGSWSIKAVLPTLAPELAYDKLDGAQSGLEAQELYLEALDHRTAPTRHDEIRRALLAYCAHDTLAMVVALERLSAPTA